MRAKRNPTGKTIEKGPWLGPDVLDFPAIAVIIVIKNDLASFSFSLFPIAMASNPIGMACQNDSSTWHVPYIDLACMISRGLKYCHVMA